MIRLVEADLLKLRRRRGLWGCLLALPAGIALIGVMLDLTGVADADGGAPWLDDGRIAVALMVVLMAIITGARLGAEEHVEGTLRYQLLTGTPRAKLYGSKVLVLLTACAAATAAGTLALVLGALILERAPGTDGITSESVVDAAWVVFLPGLVFGCVALGIGALMRSTGPAIAVALLLNLVGLQILVAIVPDLAFIPLDLALDRLTLDEADADDRRSIGGAIATTVGWVVAMLGAGYAKLVKLEA